MTHQTYLYLKLLLRNNLLLDLDEYALTNTRLQGLVCDFMGMSLSSAFQPIFRTNGDVIGREALLRAATPVLGKLAPDTAFSHAVGALRLVQFDRLVRTIHLLNHSNSFDEHELLFLNVHPRLLDSVSGHGRTFEQILHYYSVPTSRVVIELKEFAAEDYARLKEAVNNYRSLGYKIAVDNFGATYSGLDKAVNRQLDSLARVLDLQPDIVKLDGALLREAEHKSCAMDVVCGLANIFRSADIQVIITGIETPEQLGIARHAGADLLQGYHLGYPQFIAEPQAQPMASSSSRVSAITCDLADVF